MSTTTQTTTTEHPKHTVFIGGIPPDASDQEIMTDIPKNHHFTGKWSLVLKGKRGKKGHLGFGFIHCHDRRDKEALIGLKRLKIFGKFLECKPAWTIEEHKKKTHSDRLKKLYISCLKKSTKQGKNQSNQPECDEASKRHFQLKRALLGLVLPPQCFILSLYSICSLQSP